MSYIATDHVTTLAPHTATEIAAALRRVHVEGVAYWSAFPTATFLAPIGAAWSPAENVRHLTKSMRAVTRGLRMPRLLLLLAFRRPKSASRSYEEVREWYRARLAKGADAGAFAPGPSEAAVDAETARTRIMSYHAQAVAELCAALERWPERALDQRQLPHPLLGPLTVREMLFFTAYHNQHHVDVVRRRLGAL